MVSALQLKSHNAPKFCMCLNVCLDLLDLVDLVCVDPNHHAKQWVIFYTYLKKAVLVVLSCGVGYFGKLACWGEKLE